MIKIKKGVKVREVPKSAYNNFYKGAGWEIAEPDEETYKEENPINERNAEDKNEEDEWADYEEDEVEKPLSEMNGTELREKAESLGIDVTGLTNKQMREKIKNHSL